MANPIALLALAAGAFFLLGRREGEEAEEESEGDGELTEEDEAVLLEAQQSMATRDVVLDSAGATTLQVGTGSASLGANAQLGGATLAGIATLGEIQQPPVEPWTPPSTMGMKVGQAGHFYWVIGGSNPAFYSIREGQPYAANEVESRVMGSIREAYDEAQDRAAWFAMWGHG